MRIVIFTIVSLSFICSSCQEVNPNFQEEAANVDYMHQSVQKLTDIIVRDIFSPPQASRNYVYPIIAAYEAMVCTHGDTLGANLGRQGLRGNTPQKPGHTNQQIPYSVQRHNSKL